MFVSKRLVVLGLRLLTLFFVKSIVGMKSRMMSTAVVDGEEVVVWVGVRVAVFPADSDHFNHGFGSLGLVAVEIGVVVVEAALS